MYQRFLDGDDDVKKMKKEEDPFWEPPDDVMIGTANVFLQSLSYALDFDDKLSITDYKVSFLLSCSCFFNKCFVYGFLVIPMDVIVCFSVISRDVN